MLTPAKNMALAAESLRAVSVILTDCLYVRHDIGPSIYGKQIHIQGRQLTKVFAFLAWRGPLQKRRICSTEANAFLL